MDRNAISELINSVDDILKQYECISDSSLRIAFLDSNKTVFISFLDSLYSILINGQFMESTSPLYTSLQNVIFKLLSLNLSFETSFQLAFLKDFIIMDLKNWEIFFAKSLDFQPSLPKIKLALQHFNTRKKYIDLFQEKDCFKEPYSPAPYAQAYINSTYERTVLENSMTFILDNFNTLSPYDIEELFKYIENSPFPDYLLSHINENLSPEDEAFVSKYIEFVIKLKSILTPSKVKDDKFVQAMWNGKISNPEFLALISSNISLDVFASLIEPKNNSLADIATHFENQKLPPSSIAAIMHKILEKEEAFWAIAEFLPEIDFPHDTFSFVSGEYFSNFSWIMTPPYSVIELLLKRQTDFENASDPFLPFKYYIGVLDNFSCFHNSSEHFLDNLYTLLRTDYFSEEEKQEIQKRLDEYDLNSPYKVDTQIVFDGNESFENLSLKIKQAYYSGQTIPLSIALNIFNNTLAGTLSPDSTILQACVQSTICNILLSMGITEEYQVFFGEDDTCLGKQDSTPPPSIWINASLLTYFSTANSLERCTELFDTIFHECNHAFQFHIIESGNIDFYCYNWILENTIAEYNPDFYPENYGRFFIESDSRKEGILGHLNFLHELNPDFTAAIRQSLEEKYFIEASRYSLSKDSKKTFKIGNTTLTMDVSDYVGYLIKDNPGILTDTPILNIGYHQDGSQKSIAVLLEEFEQGTYANYSDYGNIYSIYYGLISKALTNSPTIDETLQEKIHHFKSKAPCSASMNAVQDIAESVSPEDISALFDRVEKFTLFPQLQSKEVVSDVNTRG